MLNRGASNFKNKRALGCLLMLGILCRAPFLMAEPSSQEAYAPSALKSENPAETQDLKSDLFVPSEKVSLVVNLPATRLDFYVNDHLQKSYRVAIGMPKYPTPIETLNISYIVWNPWWIPPDSDWAKGEEKTPPGPGNPLGPVKMLMEDGVRIHGTNAPGSIGRAASHACMRMKSAEAAELAWEIQKRYSSKGDPQLRELYRKKNRSSFWVPLGQEVPVYIKYQQVERNGDKLAIHPDRYRKGGFQQELEVALSDRPDISIDKNLIQKLSKKRAQGSFEVAINDLKELELLFPEKKRPAKSNAAKASPPVVSKKAETAAIPIAPANPVPKNNNEVINW